MEYTHLKAKLYELLDEKSKLQEENRQLKCQKAEVVKQLDEVRGELKTAINIAGERATMVRMLSQENRAIRTGTELTEEMIEKVADILKGSIASPTDERFIF